MKDAKVACMKDANAAWLEGWMSHYSEAAIGMAT
jgi:hypothetical protein